LSKDFDPDAVYPDGDSYIPIDPLGSLLLFANKYSLNPDQMEDFLQQYTSKDLLTVHQRLVNYYLDEASFNIIDAILLLGLHLSTKLSPNDIPLLHDPTTSSSSDFLEYLQVTSRTPISVF
jgi:hypothetical protein